jgi:hypothetical protein
MSEKIPNSIINLAEKNKKILENLKYISIITMANYDFEQSQNIGKDYMEKILPQNKYILKLGEMNSITEIPDSKKELIDDLISQNIGMILVRPEMYHIYDKFIDFIKNLGLKVFYDDERVINYDQYWTMYKGSIRFPEAIYSMPTRTMVYTNSPSRIIAFVDPDQKQRHLATYFESQFKGKEGVFNLKTLRGGVVYPEAKNLGFEGLNNEEVEIAVDPFKGYRHLVKNFAHHKDNNNINPDEQILRYNAVGVHIPNSNELPFDLSTLNTEAQLNEINTSLVKCLTKI